MTTERPIPTGEGLTFEKVWAMFQETDRKFQEMREEREEEFRKQRLETDREREELRKQMKETDRKIGELGNRFGELAEHLVAPGIARRFNELGYHFDTVTAKGYTVCDEKGNEKTEIDILLENGDFIIAVEVKTRTKIQDIDHHIKRLEILRENRNRHHDTRKIYGAMAGAVFGIEEKQAAVKSGFYVIVQSGDTVKIEIPDGFVPQEW